MSHEFSQFAVGRTRGFSESSLNQPLPSFGAMLNLNTGGLELYGRLQMKSLLVLSTFCLVAARCWADQTAALNQDTGTAITDLNSGLVLHYNFDANEAGVVTDQSGSGYTGTKVGSPVWTNTGISGGCYLFSNSWVDAGNVLDVGGSASALTVCVWAKLPAPNPFTTFVSLVTKNQDSVPYRGWTVELDLHTSAAQRWSGVQYGAARAQMFGTFPEGAGAYYTNSVADGNGTFCAEHSRLVPTCCAARSTWTGACRKRTNELAPMAPH